MKITDLLFQDTVTLETGSHLIVNTRAEGYLPTFKDTVSLASGQKLYRLIGVGTADEISGEFAKRAVVQLVQNDDLTGYKEDTANPIILIGDGKVVYMTGRNSRIAKDGYHDRQAHTEAVPAGQEDRNILAAFIEFAQTEFSLGVNHFQVAGPDYLEPGEEMATPEEAPTEAPTGE